MQPNSFGRNQVIKNKKIFSDFIFLVCSKTVLFCLTVKYVKKDVYYIIRSKIPAQKIHVRISI